MNGPLAFSVERNRSHKIHATAAAHKTKIHEFFATLALDAGVKKPQAFATKLQVLMEGTMVLMQLTGDTDIIRQSAKTVRVLLAAESL